MRTFCLLLVMLLIGGAVAAQDDAVEDHALRDMLRYVPITMTDPADTASYIAYLDFPAVLTAGGDLDAYPRTETEFDLAQQLFGFNLAQQSHRIIAAPPNFLEYFMIAYPAMDELVGFEWFAINQAVSFGAPPTQGLILAGDFDTDAIIDAWTARGYVEDEIGGLPALCAADGCDQGMQISPEARDPANPFGGALGRTEPLAYADGLLLNSPSDETIAAMAAAPEGESVLDDPLYAALVDAITAHEDETLLQAVFMSFAWFSGDVALNREQLAGELVTPSFQDSELPPFYVAALVDKQNGDTQIHLLAVAYASADAAEQAADVLETRLADFDPAERFEAKNVTPLEATVYAGENAHIVVVGVEYPLDPEYNGIILRDWWNAILRREFTPLSLG